jgi:iron-sulfur cluster assembly accessory protein
MSEELIVFTKEALDALKRKLEVEDSNIIRVGVTGGGCSGYQYLMDVQTVQDKRSDDLELTFDEWLTVYVDPISAGYLEGTKIEFELSLNQEGFRFINPNAKRTCGCGKSFG